MPAAPAPTRLRALPAEALSGLGGRGLDAAGKGGALRRATEKIDPRGYQVYAIGAPDGEDKTHHYLWRFWRRLKAPSEKQVLIFDRSWYGRVLVERVEGFATEAEWKRAYREINEFERQLTEHDMILVKLWFQHQQGRAAAALRRTSLHAAQDLETHRGRLAQPREVGRL